MDFYPEGMKAPAKKPNADYVPAENTAPVIESPAVEPPFSEKDTQPEQKPKKPARNGASK